MVVKSTIVVYAVCTKTQTNVSECQGLERCNVSVSKKNTALIQWAKDGLKKSGFSSPRRWSIEANKHTHCVTDLIDKGRTGADTVADLARVAGLDVIEALIAHGCLRADEVPGDLSEREWLFVSGLRRLQEVQQDFVFDSIELQLKRNTDRESTVQQLDTPQEA
jgi:hypothetical protein